MGLPPAPLDISLRIYVFVWRANVFITSRLFYFYFKRKDVWCKNYWIGLWKINILVVRCRLVYSTLLFSELYFHPVLVIKTVIWIDFCHGFLSTFFSSFERRFVFNKTSRGPVLGAEPDSAMYKYEKDHPFVKMLARVCNACLSRFRGVKWPPAAGLTNRRVTWGKHCA